MHIHDFHSKLTSGSEEGNLFYADVIAPYVDRAVAAVMAGDGR